MAVVVSLMTYSGIDKYLDTPAKHWLNSMSCVQQSQPPMTCPDTPASTALILTLPPELLLHLVATLTSDPTSYHSLLALRLTHPLFYNDIPLSTLKSQHALLSAHYFQNEVAFLICDARNRPSTSPDFWPCYICLHLHPLTNFAHSQSHIRKSLAHVSARLRFCLSCGVRKGIYVPGLRVRRFQGPDKVVCLSCRRFGTHANVSGKVAVKLLQRFKAAEMMSSAPGSSPADMPDDVPKNAVKVDDKAIVSGLCRECVYGGGSHANEAEADENKVRKSKRWPGAYFVERLLALESSRQRVFHTSTGELRGRCQRCWDVDHTERAVHRVYGGQLFCRACWLRRWI